MTVEELRYLKDEKGISLANLAELSGVPIGTVIKVFSGDSKNPRPATLAAIERALKDALPKYKRADDTLAVRNSTLFDGSNTLKMDGNIEGLHGITTCEDILAGEKGDGIYTIDDYYNLPDGERYELIDGFLIRMEAPSILHQRIIMEFCVSTYNQVKVLKGKCKVIQSPFDVRILKDDRNMLQPDATIICDDTKDIKKRIEGAPDMVLEVLSPSNSRTYMFKKRFIYTVAGVKEYWIIDPMGKRLVTYRADENYRMHTTPLEGEHSLAISDGLIKIDLGEIRKIIDEYEEFETENASK